MRALQTVPVGYVNVTQDCRHETPRESSLKEKVLVISLSSQRRHILEEKVGNVEEKMRNLEEKVKNLVNLACRPLSLMPIARHLSGA